MFWDKSKRFVKAKQGTERPYSDNVVINRDDIAKNHKGGPKMVDDWRQSPSTISSTQQSGYVTSLQPIPPKDPQHSNTSGFRRAGSQNKPPLIAADSVTNAIKITEKSHSPTRPTPAPSTTTTGSPTGGTLVIETGVLNVPGPCSYYPEHAPQFQAPKGTIIFSHPQVEKRKPHKPNPPLPAPGVYFQPSSMVKPSFNKLAHKDEQDDEPPPPPVHRIVLDLKMCSIGKRSSVEERETVRKQAKTHLDRLAKMNHQSIEAFIWPPKASVTEESKDVQDCGGSCQTNKELGFDELDGMTMQAYVDSIVGNVAAQFDNRTVGTNEQKNTIVDDNNKKDVNHGRDLLSPIAAYIQGIIEESAMKLACRDQVQL
jgi:hypothetical protein